MTQTVNDLVGYRKFVGVSDSVGENVGEVTQLKNTLCTELLKKSSSLKDALGFMSEDKKALLVSALISNDKSAILTHLLPLVSPLDPQQKSLVENLRHITEHDVKTHNSSWLNQTVTLLITAMLHEDPSHQELQRNSRILTQAMQLIPELKIDIKAKVALCKTMDFMASKMISDYSYSESLSSTSSTTFSGKISDKEYQTALQTTPLDYSEYIMLTLGVLQDVLSDPQDFIDLNQIRQLYLNVRYEDAISKITEMTTRHQASLGELYPLIVAAQKNLVEVDIYKNYSRRFFENKLSQFYMESHIDLQSIDRISTYLIGKRVTNTNEAEVAVLDVSEVPFDGAQERVTALKNQSAIYSKKDRWDKAGFMGKEEESVGQVGEKVYSRNKGVMTANAPNFYDELSVKDMRNKVVDIAATFDDESGYSFANPRSAFVGSVSGHCFKIVATLEKYMKEHKDDINLGTDINNFLKATVASYISKGYHGFSEMVDILKEPHIQQIFEDNKVALDLNWMDNLVGKASKETQEYTKTLCIKNVVNSELKKMVNPENQKITQKFKQQIQTIKEDKSSIVVTPTEGYRKS